MSRLIDADKLEPHEIYEDNGFTEVVYMDDIREMPTVEADVVRCKDCKYWELQSIIPPIPYGYCYYKNDKGEGFDPRRWNADDFCSRGEKK